MNSRQRSLGWPLVACALVAAQAIAGGFTDHKGPPLVGLKGGKLHYTQTADGDQIPDFSHCGYRGGGVKLPDVPVAITLKPTPQGDDTARIQAAIDKVSSLRPNPDGHRGAVLLEAGTFRVEGSLRIQASGVVLRGRGPRAGGTVIIATGKGKRSLISINGGQPGVSIEGTKKVITAKRVAVGSHVIPLNSTSGLSAGDEIHVVRYVNDAWIRAVGGNRGFKVAWNVNDYTMDYDRRIVHVAPQAITIDVPIVCAIDKEWGGGAVFELTPDSRIRETGVEQLRMVSEFAAGQENTDESHAWTAVQFENVIDGWARDITAQHFGYSCTNVRRYAKRITVQDCACLDPVSIPKGGRRYSFSMGGECCLVQRCYTRHGRHDFVMDAWVRGPNVFLDCVAEKALTDSGPHQRWSTGTLYDNIKCGALNVVDRGKSGTGHGWTGATMVHWNCRPSKFTCDKPPTGNNYSFGTSGLAAKHIKGSGHFESTGTPVQPRRLYLAQLQDRLGTQAVINVTTKAQQTGTLDAWIRETLSK